MGVHRVDLQQVVQVFDPVHRIQLMQRGKPSA